MSKNSDHDNNEVTEDRGIPPLSTTKQSQFVMAAGITTVVTVVIYFAYSGFAQSQDVRSDALQAKVEEPYDRERIQTAPEVSVADESASATMFPLPKPALPAAVEPVETGLSEEEMYKRRRSPLVVYDMIQVNKSAESKDIPEDDGAALVDKIVAANAQADLQNSDDMDSLSARLKSTETQSIKASLIQDPDFLIAQGKMISAVIETAISSDLPGKVRAIVNEVIYSENGVTPIITKGSRVIGEYRAGIVRGQGRLFVIWNRIITPEGIDIQIQSPGTDQLGRSGHDGWIDTHFVERFGASFLLSTVGAAASQSGDSEFEEQLGDNLNSSAEIALSESIDIRPTLYKNQGEAINIFVARDLNFRDAMTLVQR